MIQNPFIYCSTQDVFEHLTEELAQLFLILLKFVSLLNQQILNTLPIDRPMDERYLWNLSAIIGKILLDV